MQPEALPLQEDEFMEYFNSHLPCILWSSPTSNRQKHHASRGKAHMGLLDILVDELIDSVLGPANELNTRRHRHDCPEESKLHGDKLTRLAPGTPVFCYFTGEIAEHTGICLGDTIVHLDGTGKVICTSPEVFLARLEGKKHRLRHLQCVTWSERPVG